MLALAGLMIPAHLRSVDHAVLRAAADHEESTAERIGESLKAAHIGPAARIIEATRSESAEYTQIIERLKQSNPRLRLGGGPDRSFEGFLQLASSSRLGKNDSVPPIISILLPRNQRLAMLQHLRDSSDANVASLLRAREIEGLEKLHPAQHAAGAPYDAAILTLALLIDGSHFDPAFGSRIGEIATLAATGESQAVRSIEALAMATLSLGRQLDLRSLANLASFTDTIPSWAEMATLFRARPDDISKLYAILYFEEDGRRLFDYISEHSEQGMTDLASTLQIGPGSVAHLLKIARPIHQTSGATGTWMASLTELRPDVLTEFTIANREAALALKLILFLLAGLLLALALGALWRGLSKEAAGVSRANPSVIARNVLTSCVFTICLWIVFEPEVLKSPDPGTESAPRIEFAVASALESLQSPVKAMQELNQVTLLVLVLFFIIQLVIYCFCLIKLKEISKQSLSASMKLKLLDNEENLFDFGLYVGLGGTVLSLILVAIGIVEASLMAAYASTLFGILFVALLKVLHLRPFRRRLILEADRTAAGAAGDSNLMDDIKL
jgi:hypothetical protein